MNKSSKEKTYDFLFDYIRKFIDRFNPCGIKVVEGKVFCVSYPNGSEENALCCGTTRNGSKLKIYQCLCKYHGQEGCKTQNLSCSIAFCNDAIKNIVQNFSKEDATYFLTALQYVHMKIRRENLFCKSRYSKEFLINKSIKQK